jgi:hypothetical protein
MQQKILADMQILIGSELITKINDEPLVKLMGKVVGVGSRRGHGRQAALPGTQPRS